MSSLLNVERAERLLAEAGVDAVVGTTVQNVQYLSGFPGFGQRLNAFGQVYAVLRADALTSPTLIVGVGELDVEAQAPSGALIHPYGTFRVDETEGGLDDVDTRYQQLLTLRSSGSALEALSCELARLPANARVAIDERAIAPSILDEVRGHFGGRIVPGSDLLSSIRMVKTREEVRRLEAAALAIESSYEAALAVASEGISELELTTVFNHRTIAQHCSPRFAVIGFGSHSAHANAIPGDERRLQRSDVIRFDIGCEVDGYQSDIARTAVLGEPHPRIASYYDAILAGEDAMLEAIRPGVSADSLFHIAVEATRRAGIPHYQRHHVGHGVGLDTYDPPLLAPGVDTELEAGMVLEIETPYYEIGFAGLQVEDTVLVTSQGSRLLTRTNRALRRIGAD